MGETYIMDTESDSDAYEEIDYPDETDCVWSDEEDDDDAIIEESVPRYKVEVPEKSLHTPVKNVVPKVQNHCPICFDPLQQNVVYCSTVCGNTFHRTCVNKLNRCPMCRTTPVFLSLNKEKKKEIHL